MKKTVFSFYTLGCRLNQAEEESFRRELAALGFLVSAPEKADYCIINTCSVTALAEKKSRQAIRHLKSANPNLKIIITGCASASAASEVKADLVVSNKEKEQTIKKVLNHFYIEVTKDESPGPKKYRTRALLKVQDGCDNFCAYCIVPFLRGREVSRPVDEILEEAVELDRLGYRELVISGVNVGKYKSILGEDTLFLVDLLRLLLQKTDFPRIRLSSINPQDLSDDLIQLWSQEERLCRHFHLSLQSGSNGVLKRMGRPYTSEKYLDLINRVYELMPEMGITTDLIVGFPGETDQDFKNSLNLIREARLAKVHVFRYSNREGTRAAKDPEQIPAQVIKARSIEAAKVSDELHQNFINRNLGTNRVLFEYKRNGYWTGLTSNYIRVRHKSDEDLSNKLMDIPLHDLCILD